MRMSLSRLGHPSIAIIPFYCLFFVCCGILDYKYIKNYEGPELPSGQVAKLYLDRGDWEKPAARLPVSFEVDGKPHRNSLNSIPDTPCLLIVPGEHDVILLAEPHRVVLREEGIHVAGIKVVRETFNTLNPSPDRHIFKFNAEKGREYVLAQERSEVYLDSMYIIFWIEDKISKNRITEEFRFDWK